jgi:predicted ATPase
LKHNLPAQTTLFVGREAELCELARLVEDPGVRLLSIVGAGGMGKTRLAVEAGLAQVGNFGQGVYFISPAPLQSVEAIVPTIAQALSFSFYEGGEPRQELLDYLREKHMLLILDNFEHLLVDTEAGSLVSDILEAAQRVKLLITSRVRLGLEQEHLFHLGGMDYPDLERQQDAVEFSAIKLFLQAARRARPGFELATDDLTHVVHICQLVDGMPLGILLATAWVEILTPAEIAAEMQQSIDFLQTDLPAASERQRSLRAVFDYSWNLLTEPEQEVFRGLSVFRGGFTREAAQQVTGASLRELLGLANKSLIHRVPTGRYEIHELLRQYGAEKLTRTLAKQSKTRDDHCAFFTSFIHNKEARLGSKDQRIALAEIQVEIENIRSAWDWAIEQGKLEEISTCLESLAEFYRLRGWFLEGEQALDSAAQRLVSFRDSNTSPETTLLLGRILLRQGLYCDSLGLTEKGSKLLQEALAIFRTLCAQREAAYALCYLAGCGSLYGGPSAYLANRKEYCQEGLMIFKRINDQRGMALALKGLAWISLNQGSYFEAKQLFQDSLEMAAETGNLEGTTTALGGLGYTHWILGEYHRAQELHQEMLALATEAGDQGGIARALGDLGIDACVFKNFEESRHLWMESLSIYREIGNPEGIADELGDLGEVFNLLGEYQQAAEYAKESLAIYQQIKSEPRIWSTRVLGNAEFGLGNTEIAKKYLCQALNLAWTRQLLGHILNILVAIANILASEDQREWAMEVLALVFSHPASWQLAKDIAAPINAKLEAELPPEVVTAAQERGRRRDLEATVAELLLELKD